MGRSDSRLLSEPWRDIKWGSTDKLSDVKRYKPVGVSHLRILLYGPVGAGKSTFINTVIGLIRGHSANVAPVSSYSKATHSFTVEYQTHRFKMCSSDDDFPVVFTDIMGLEGGDNRGVRPDYIKLAMQGHVKEGYRFHPDSDLSPQDKYYNPEPELEDQVHVLVCMIDASKPDISQSVIQKMKEVREAARDLGIPQVAVVSHIDEDFDEINENVQNVFRSKSLKEKMTELSAYVGIPLNYMFPVWTNYEGVQKDSADTLLLIALKNMMNYGDDFIDSRKH